jgi:glucose/arabinose dehydrogenase
MKRIYFVAGLFVLALIGCGAPNAMTPTAALKPNVNATAIPSAAAQNAPSVMAVTPSLTSASATQVSNPASAPTKVVAPAGPIHLPAGFGISVFASGLSVPRNMAIGPDGELYVAERGKGRIVRLADRNHDGISDGIEVIAPDFDRPSSLAFIKDDSLYVSTPTQVFRLSDPDANGVFQKREVVIDGLPGPQDHFTRTLLFSPDGSSLFIQIGSSRNICQERDERRATIMRFNPDGSGGAIYARGLRNAVGTTFRPATNELWATNNGTDNLGDDQPPDTIQIVQQDEDYGWPRCHAGTIVDPEFGGANGCNDVAQPLINLQAHSAALGLAFYNGTQFPPEYRGDLFVAFHGSIFRSVPTGYKVVRIHFTNSQPGAPQDFVTGWLQGNRAWGRPVDLVTAADGSLLVSDDSGGMIYRIYYAGS